MYRNWRIPSGIAFTANTRPRIYAALDAFWKRENVRQTVNETVHCTLGFIIFYYLKLQKTKRLHILYLYFMTCLIHTNFAQWQYVFFFSVLIFAQVNFGPKFPRKYFNAVLIVVHRFLRVIFVLIFARE